MGGLRLGANAGSVFGPCDPDAFAVHPPLHDELLPKKSVGMQASADKVESLLCASLCKLKLFALHTRFFFPWPKQPYQCYCETSERVALQRRHAPDDSHVVPHNLYLTMYSPSSVNVLAFDSARGSDHARAYAPCLV